MSYLRYFRLFTYSGAQPILCYITALVFFVLCTLCCQFLLDFPVLIAPSVFSNVYLSLVCTARTIELALILAIMSDYSCMASDIRYVLHTIYIIVTC
jgi:hypothetical protein